MRSSRGTRSIRSRLSGAMVVVALVPVLVVGVVAVTSLDLIRGRSATAIAESREELTDDVVGGQLAAGARQVVDRLERHFVERFDDLVVVSREPAVTASARSGAPTPEARAAAAEVVTDQAEVLGLGWTDAAGRPVVATGTVALDGLADQGWWEAAVADGLSVGPLALDRDALTYTVTLATRIDDPDGGPALGVVVADLRTTAFFDAADDYRLATAGRSQVTITDDRLRLLAETESANAGHRMLVDDLPLTEERRAILSEPLEEETGLPADHAHAFGRYLTGHADDGEVVAGEDPARSTSLPWIVTVLEPRSASIGALTALDGLPDQVESSTGLVTAIVALLVLAVGAITLVVARLLARRVTDPLHRLQGAAQRLADEELPEAMLQLAYDPDAELPPVTLDVDATEVEVRDLAGALGSAARTALDVAQEQARSGRRTSELFVSLGRRNQNLIGRQLDLIEDMEHDEEDPDRLGRLFDLDSLATRMRRNAESLLVLAGEVSPQTWAGAVPVAELVRAAASEVEDYRRVTRADMETILVRGDAVADVAHLLAELVENALRYSPPTTKVWVGGRRHGTGYAIAVSDQGIGFSEDTLAAANATIAAGDDQDLPTNRLGLYVVARLARRLGCRVQLVANGDGPGTTAWVLLAPALLREPEPGEAVGTVPTARPAPPAQTAPTATGSGRRDGAEQPAPAPAAPADRPVTTATNGTAGTNDTATMPTAAAATAEPRPVAPAGVAGTTPSGLVRRQPRATSAPAEGSGDDRPTADVDPDAVQARLRAFQSSVARGRAATAAVGDDTPTPRPERETTP